MLKTVMEKREKRPQAEQTEQALRGTRGNELESATATVSQE